MPNCNCKEYNGWTNYETWNVALWITGDERFYNIAKECKSFENFVATMKDELEQPCTPDNVGWDLPCVNKEEVERVFEDL